MIYENLVYIHIPKTGGSSIRNSLGKNYNLIFNASKDNLKKMGFMNLNKKFETYDFSIGEFKDHLPYQMIIEKKLDYNKFVFTFVRNPFSRLISLYFECLGNNFHIKDLNTNNNINFEQFVNIITEKPYWFTIPMIDYIGVKNVKKIDFLGKFENFESDIFKLKKKLKISIKHHNFNNQLTSKFKFSDYRSFYSNNKIIDKVNTFYEKDFEVFQYDYEKFLDFEKNKIKLTTIFSRIIKRKIINLI